MDNVFDLKQTRGTFEARGVLFNTQSERAFTEKTVKGNRQWKSCNLGLRLSDSEVMYLTLNGMEQDFVYFSKPNPKKGEKALQKKVEWAKRNRFNEEGYRLMGVGIALHKDEDTGKNVEVKVYTPFDAVAYLKENAVDGMSVFVKGTIEYSSFDDGNGNLKKSTKYVLSAIYLTKDPIDFQADGFEKSAEFVQPLVFTAARREDGKFFLDATVIGYKSIEDISLETNEALAETMRKRVKPFTCIAVTGQITSTQSVDEVKTEVWGEDSSIGRNRTPSRTVLMVKGARPETINEETYTESILGEFRSAVIAEKKSKAAAEKSFDTQKAQEEWGDKGKVNPADEEDW